MFLEKKINSISFQDKDNNIYKYYINEDNKRCFVEFGEIKNQLLKKDGSSDFLRYCFIEERITVVDASFLIEYNKIDIEDGSIGETIITHKRTGKFIKSTKYWLRPDWGFNWFDSLIVSDHSQIKIGDQSFRNYPSALELAVLWADSLRRD